LCSLLTELYLRSPLPSQFLKQSQPFEEVFKICIAVLTQFEEQAGQSAKGCVDSRLYGLKSCVLYGVLPCVQAYYTFFGAAMMGLSPISSAQRDHIGQLLAALASSALLTDDEEQQIVQTARLAVEGSSESQSFSRLDAGRACAVSRAKYRDSMKIDKRQEVREVANFRVFKGCIGYSRYIKRMMQVEFDGLVEAVENITVLTDPEDPAFNKLSNEAQLLDRRTNAVLFPDLINRITRRVTVQLKPSPEQEEVYLSIFRLLRKLMEKQLVDEEAGINLLLPPVLDRRIKQEIPVSPTIMNENWFTVWKRVTIDRLNSFLGILFILSVVVASYLCGTLPSVEAAIGTGGVGILGWVFGFFFLGEVFLRITCVGIVAYVKDPMCDIDILCTVVDFTFLIGNASGLLDTAGTGGGASMGRMLRLIRIARFLRFLRIIDALKGLLMGMSEKKTNEREARLRHAGVQAQLSECGAVVLVVASLSGVDLGTEHLFEVLQLGIRLVENGNKRTQDKVLAIIDRDKENTFLATNVGKMRQLARKFTSLRGVQDSTSMHEMALLFRFMQLLCEGHHSQMQHYFRFQAGMFTSFNVLEAAGNLFCAVAKDEDTINRIGFDEAEMLYYLLEFLIEAIQGPCVENQIFLAEHPVIAKCASLLGANMRGVYEQDVEWASEEDAAARLHPLSLVHSAKGVKTQIAKLLFSMTEQNKSPQLSQMLVDAIDLDVINRRFQRSFMMYRYMQNKSTRRNLSDEQKYRIYNAAMIDWLAKYFTEGDLLMALCQTLRGQNEAFGERIDFKRTDLGCSDESVSRNFEAVDTSYHRFEACYTKFKEPTKATDANLNLLFQNATKVLKLCGLNEDAKHFRFVAKTKHRYNVMEEVLALKSKCRSVHSQALSIAARLFFISRVCCVEITGPDDVLHLVHFPAPKNIKMELAMLSRDVDTSTDEDKLKQFVNRWALYTHHMIAPQHTPYACPQHTPYDCPQHTPHDCPSTHTI
jgi:hypothetical protein